MISAEEMNKKAKSFNTVFAPASDPVVLESISHTIAKTVLTMVDQEILEAAEAGIFRKNFKSKELNSSIIDEIKVNHPSVSGKLNEYSVVVATVLELLEHSLKGRGFIVTKTVNLMTKVHYLEVRWNL